MTRVRRQAGFTMLETLVVLAVGSLLYLLLGESLSSSSKLASISRAELQAKDDSRKSLDAICALLRGASWESLDGFLGNDTSTAPTFQRPTTSGEGGYVLDTVERLRWRSTPSVDGVQSAGEVVHEKDGQVVVVAPRVPGGGFRVERTGTTLTVFLTTYASTSQRVVAQTTSEALVALRN